MRTYRPGIAVITATGAIGAMFLSASALATPPARMADLDPDQIQRFTGKVDAPDVVGGYASTHVIIRTVPGVQPGQTDAGSLTLTKIDADADQLADLVAVEQQIADVFETWSVEAIEPTARAPFAHPELAAQFGLDRYLTLHVPDGTATRDFVDVLNTFNTHIEIAEVDGIGGIFGDEVIPNDPSFNQQYGLRNTGQTIGGVPGTPGADISATEAWALHTGTDDIIVAIIDTGVSDSHPDLASKKITGYNATDGSNNTDDSWLIPHGTHVAGIAAAATNNGTGVAGVSWGAKIMPIKVLDLFGGGSETNIANGVIWSADNGAHVGNMSLGVPDGITYFENACAYAHEAGVLLVAATGNTPGVPIFPPAKWSTVVAVGATDNQDNLADFTTTGPEMSVSAPGVNVFSTWDDLFAPNTYTLQSGTSMASPHTAGLAALIWSADLSLTNDDIWAVIEQTADDKGVPGWDPLFGHGRINALAALQAVLEEPCDAADLNCDGVIDGGDLAMLLAAWGACGDPDACPADLSGDGNVDGGDLAILLAAWSD